MREENNNGARGTAGSERVSARSLAIAALWALTVAAAWIAAYACSLLQYAGRAAERSPFLQHILQLLHTGN